MEHPQPRISFDRLASLFDDQRALPPAADAALHTAFGELVDAGMSTLIEPGAGTGRIAIAALAAGFRVTALDVSRPMLDVLERRLAAIPQLVGRCAIVVGDATALPLADASVDAGVLAQVLYLIPAWERALDEAVRVVRPGGRVLLVQERTRMSPALEAWDAAWRAAVATAGHVAIPQVPDDLEAARALGMRTTGLEERSLATWDFGQTAGEALAGLDRMRPLYSDLDDAAWATALASFHRWPASSAMADDTLLDGTVTLMLISGSVPSST